MQKSELGSYLTPHIAMTSKWINQQPKYKSLNHKTLRRKSEVNLHGLVFGNRFLDMASKAQTAKEKKTDKMDFIKI